MIRHIVIFKLKNRDSEHIKKVVAVLKSLGKIDLMASLEVGIDFKKLDRSYDIAFISSFLSRQDMDKYQKLELHQTVKEYMREVAESILSVDYETD